MPSLNMRVVSIIAVLVGVLVCSATLFGADTRTETTKFFKSDPMSGDQFGNAVALWGDRALVGAYQDDIGADFGVGSVSLFSDQGAGSWERTGVFQGQEEGAQFGWSVSLFDNTALIGSRLADVRGNNSGSAILLRESANGNWNTIATLIGSDTSVGEQFGISVATTSTAAIVGSSFKNAAYIFRDDGLGNWSEEAKVTASDADARDQFGVSVAISGDTVLVGAPGHDEAGSSSGAAYIFRDDGSGNWDEVFKLTASDAAAGKFFGSRVSLFGNTAIVGTTNLEDQYAPPDSAYVFRDDGTGTWTEVGKLTVGPVQSVLSVAISDGVAIVGSPGDDDLGIGGGTDPGVAYVFLEDDIGNWDLTHILVASDGMAGDGFGRSVAVSGSTFLIGAQFNDEIQTSSGAAYLFIVPEPTSQMILCGLLVVGTGIRRRLRGSC